MRLYILVFFFFWKHGVRARHFLPCLYLICKHQGARHFVSIAIARGQSNRRGVLGNLYVFFCEVALPFGRERLKHIKRLTTRVLFPGSEPWVCLPCSLLTKKFFATSKFIVINEAPPLSLSKRFLMSIMKRSSYSDQQTCRLSTDIRLLPLIASEVRT